MAFRTVTALTFVSSWLFTLALAQLSFDSTTSAIREFCSNDQTTYESVLSGCGDYSGRIRSCNEAEGLSYSSCLCQQTNADLLSSCYSEYSTCLGGGKAALNISPLISVFDFFCTGTSFVGAGPTGAGPAATGAGSPSATITGGLNPGASSTQEQPLPTTSPSSASGFKPVYGLLSLLTVSVIAAGFF